MKKCFNKKSPFKISDIVTLPRGFTYGRRKFKITKRFSNGLYQLQFLGGKEKNRLIECYHRSDLLKVKKVQIGI